MANITGKYNLANFGIYPYCKAEFHLSAADTDADAAYIPDAVSVIISSDGSIDAELWENDNGSRGTVYTNNVVVYADSSYQREVKRIGMGKIVVIGDAEIQDLLVTNVVPSTQEDALALAQAAAASAEYDADRADAAADRADAAADRADAAADVAVSIANGTIRALATVADMKAVDIAAGAVVRTAGYFAAGDMGGATYQIVDASGAAPDGYGEHILANGRYARLVHNGEIACEWFGAVSGREVSAALNAANAFAMAVNATSGAVTLTFSSSVTAKDPVIIGTGAVGSSNLDGPGPAVPNRSEFTVKMSGRIIYAAGGALQADGTNYVLTVAGISNSKITTPTIRADWACNGLKLGGLPRCEVAPGYVSRGKDICVIATGNCGGARFVGISAHQVAGTAAQSAMTGSALVVDTDDCSFWGGQLGAALYPVWIKAGSGGISFMRIHTHNGSTSGGRVDTLNVLNEGEFNIRFVGCYFDNGYVVDKAGSAEILGCFHFYNAAWATLTHPMLRVNVGSTSALTTVVDDYRGTLGTYSGSDYMVLDALGGGSFTATQTYTNGSMRVGMGGAKVNVPYPKGSETETTISEWYQFYKDGLPMPLRWISRHADGANVIDWDRDTIRLRSPSRGNAKLSLLLGSSNIGLNSGASQSDLVFGTSGGDRWRIQNSGNFHPSTDNAYSVGTTSFRPSVIYAGSGTINTSDGREKTAPVDIDDAVLDAWGDVSLIAFQWLQAVADKGDDARLHFGVIAQQVRDAFAAHGLDGCRYGLLCYDKWDAEPEIVADSGEVLQAAKPAGDRWGIRADQCLFVEAAYQRRRADRIEARLAAIEAMLSSK